MKNATLVVHNSAKFSNDIWQCDSDFNTKQWKLAIKTFAEITQDVYDFLCQSLYDKNGKEITYPDDKLYQLGDVANMLNSIGVKKAVMK